MASTSLRRQVSVTGNRQIFTISAWVKKTKNADTQNIFSQYIGSGSATTSTHFRVRFSASDNLQVSAGGTDFLITNRLFRDTSSFYQVVVAVNTTLATADDRVKLYINGVQETSFATRNNPSQNLETVVNNSGSSQYPRVGADDSDGNGPYGFFDGVMSQVILIDGTAYAASTFGSTNSTSGEWKPNANPTVTYGTNGFKLTFEDTSNLGDDTSGNTNDLATSGSPTQTLDCPSNNFATLNALLYQNGTKVAAPTKGNTTFTSNGGAAWGTLLTTIGASSGKYYCEAKVTTLGTYAQPGICDMSVDQQNSNAAWFLGQTASSAQYGYDSNDGNLYNGGSAVSYGNSFTTGDIIGIAMDLDNSKLYFSKNGTWQNSGVPTSGSTGTGAVSITAGKTYGFGFSGYDATVFDCNFGNGYFGTTAVSSAGTPGSTPGTFEYDVPTNYQPLTTKGLNV